MKMITYIIPKKKKKPKLGSIMALYILCRVYHYRLFKMTLGVLKELKELVIFNVILLTFTLPLVNIIFRPRLRQFLLIR